MQTIDLHARRDLMRLYFDGERIQHGMPAVPPEPSDVARESLAILVDTGTVAIAIDRPTPPMFCVTENGTMFPYREIGWNSLETTDSPV